MHTTNLRAITLAVAAFAAVAALAAPARAAVIEISSTADRSPEYAVSGGGTARLVGTISGSLSGRRYVVEETTATLLPSLRFDGVASSFSPASTYSLDPVTFALSAGASTSLALDIAVDLTVDLGAATVVGIRPDLLVSRDDNPFLEERTMLRFIGTLSTGADAANGASSAQAVPEPASIAVLGLGLAGLMAARRRIATPAA